MNEIYKRICEKADNGKKYHKTIKGIIDGNKIDVYSVIETFEVTHPSLQHALKKLLCAGTRGKGDLIQDLEEAITAIVRAIEMMTDSGVLIKPENMDPKWGINIRDQINNT